MHFCNLLHSDLVAIRSQTNYTECQVCDGVENEKAFNKNTCLIILQWCFWTSTY